MSELSLSACPICHEPNSLIRRWREVPDRVYVWYECEKCASALLWAGGDRWIYQSVGRDDKQYLLKQPLTLDDLEALLPQPEADLFEIPVSSDVPETPVSSEWFEIPAGDEMPEAVLSEEPVEFPASRDWFGIPARDEMPQAVVSEEPVEFPVSDVLEGPVSDDMLEVPFGEGVVETPAERAVAEQPTAEGKRVSILGRVIPWLLIFCLLVVLAVATIVVYKMANGTLNLPFNP
jgi:hypothetical protein